MAQRAVGAGQSIALTGTATTSTAFKVQSNVLRIVASGADAYVAIGTDPVATTTDYIVSSSEPETLAMLKMSQRVVSITYDIKSFSPVFGTALKFKINPL